MLKSLTLTLLLTGCASANLAPKLANPPVGVVNALQAAGKKDPDVASWVVGLDKFYQKQDAAAGAR